MAQGLRHFLAQLEPQPDAIGKARQIYDSVLRASRFMEQGNFIRFHADDLQHLYQQYDRTFFQRQLRGALGTTPLTFRISNRMTSAGGKTTWTRSPQGREAYEITVSAALLFRTFTDQDHRPISVSGIECCDRLQALQRVFEHELVHLAEMLAWRDSNCRSRRFQSISGRMFGHRERTHQLITPREQALARYGVRPGSRVRFRLDGKQYVGRVNRITKRATVLVPSPDGRTFSDGNKYRVFYVPLPLLETV